MDRTASSSGPGPDVIGTNTLIGDRVVNSKGEKLGRIEELVLDTGAGRIAYAVLSFGGVLGLGDKLFAVPWTALRLDADNRQFIFDVDREKLENAPGFDKNRWPTTGDARWAVEVHSYYRSTSHWI
jgi:sporulation protein YlmC with PRC-barrel domain